ncbi:MAG: hypothetical protein V1788_02415 [Nanoarchaeota archaeon]|nr:hypothetical protein [Nanoarchaeota archaeon]
MVFNPPVINLTYNELENKLRKERRLTHSKKLTGGIERKLKKISKGKRRGAYGEGYARANYNVHRLKKAIIQFRDEWDDLKQYSFEEVVLILDNIKTYLSER